MRFSLLVLLYITKMNFEAKELPQLSYFEAKTSPNALGRVSYFKMNK
jgi:hypothetical protein